MKKRREIKEKIITEIILKQMNTVPYSTLNNSIKLYCGEIIIQFYVFLEWNREK